MKNKKISADPTQVCTCGHTYADHEDHPASIHPKKSPKCLLKINNQMVEQNAEGARVAKNFKASGCRRCTCIAFRVP